MAEFNLNNTGIDRVKPTPFTIAGTIKKAIKGAALNVFAEGQEIDDPVKLSYLGTPVYSNLVFDNGNRQNPDNPLDSNDTLNYSGLSIDTVIFTVTQTRNIVTNKINGRNGTIKEFINDGDYIIEASGLITGETVLRQEADPFSIDQIKDIGSQYPIKDIERLRILASYTETLGVTSNFLGLFGIKDIVIKSLEIRQVEGAQNFAEFKLVMLSDNTDFILEV